MTSYSQNDPGWADIQIGSGPYLLGGRNGKGCTTACIADASSYFGEDKHPGILARSLQYTDRSHPLGPGLILWGSIGKVFTSFEFEWRFYAYDKQRIEQGLKDPGRVVLLNVDKGAHWVFLMGKNVPLLGYKCSDPYPHPAKIRRYKPSAIVGGAILRVKRA